MKTPTVISKPNFLNVEHYKPLVKWKRLGELLRAAIRGSELWLLELSWDGMYSQVKQTLLVNQVHRIGLSAVRAHLANKRHLVGDGCLMIGVILIFANQLFFSPVPWDKTWYYTNWFYFLEDLRLWHIIMFGSLAVLFYWPKASKSVYIIFTTLHSVGWLGWLHYSFFVVDYDSYHSLPVWDMWIVAAMFGVGFVFALNQLAYIWEHKFKGNHKRFVMLAEHEDKLDPAERKRMLTNNLNEYKNLYTNY